MSRQAYLARRARGQSALEFALVLPVFLLLISGAIEFGRGYFAYAQLLQAVQEGARYGAVLGNSQSDAGITARTQQIAPGGTADPVTISSTVSATDSTVVLAPNRARGNALSVSASHVHTVTIPFFPLSSMQLGANATMLIE